MYNIYSKMVGDYCIDKGEKMVFGIKRQSAVWLRRRKSKFRGEFRRAVNGRNLVQKGEGKLYESEKSY